MSTQVVVTLPDDLYAQAQHWAALTHCEVPQLLTEALALVLTPIGPPPANAPPVATLADTEVLALAQVQMPPQQVHSTKCTLGCLFWCDFSWKAKRSCLGGTHVIRRGVPNGCVDVASTP